MRKMTLQAEIQQGARISIESGEKGNKVVFDAAGLYIEFTITKDRLLLRERNAVWSSHGRSSLPVLRVVPSRENPSLLILERCEPVLGLVPWVSVSSDAHLSDDFAGGQAATIFGRPLQVVLG